MTRSEDVASACASVARATTREEARAALETLRARAFRASEASEASTRSSSAAADGLRIDDVEDACACALTHGRGRWYETLSARDRTRLVDDWFAARGLGGVGLAGAVRACARVSGRSTTTARGRGDGGARTTSAEETVVVESAVRYYVELARGGAIGALVRFAERAEDDAGAMETAEMTLSAFDRLDRRFEIPHYRTVEAYDAEVARQVIDAAEDAPRSAARTASRTCRRGGAAAIARATLRALAPRVRALDVEAMRGIIERSEVPESLRWATRMMNEVSDADSACRWITEMFRECDGAERSAHCSWRTFDVILRVLLRDRYWSCEATRFTLSESLLLRKGVPRAALPALLRLTMLRPITQGCDATRSKAALDSNARAIVEDWSTEDFVRCASAELQQHVTSAVRVLVTVLTKEEWDAIRGNLTSLVLKGVSARLNGTNGRVWRHAQKVAKSLSIKLDAGKPLNLFDEGDENEEDEESEWEHDVASILRDDVVVDVIEDGTEEQTPPVAEPSVSTGFDIKAVDPDEVVDMWSARRDESDSSASESDDYSDDDLVPYDMDSDDDETLRSGDPASLTAMRIASLPKPQTMRECINALRQCRSGDASTRQTDIDVADAAEGAIYALADIIAARPHELASCAADLGVAVLHAQPPTPDSDPLDRARRQGLTALFVATPGLAGPAVIKHALSGNCDASHVMDTLSSVESAMSQLASPRDVERLDDTSDDRATPVHRVGTERRFAPNSMRARAKTTRSLPSKSHVIGDSFLGPLIEAAVHRLNLEAESAHTLDGVDAMIHGQILYTLGQCVRHTQNTHEGPLFAQTVLEFASGRVFADSVHPHIRRAAFITAGLVATSLTAIPVAIAYADDAPLARALETFTTRASERHRSDYDADVRAAAGFALSALAECKLRAHDAVDRLDDATAHHPSPPRITARIPDAPVTL
jgi:hypothetical protein